MLQFKRTPEASGGNRHQRRAAAAAQLAFRQQLNVRFEADDEIVGMIGHRIDSSLSSLAVMPLAKTQTAQRHENHPD